MLLLATFGVCRSSSTPLRFLGVPPSQRAPRILESGAAKRYAAVMLLDLDTAEHKHDANVWPQVPSVGMHQRGTTTHQGSAPARERETLTVASCPRPARGPRNRSKLRFASAWRSREPSRSSSSKGTPVAARREPVPRQRTASSGAQVVRRGELGESLSPSSVRN